MQTPAAAFLKHLQALQQHLACSRKGMMSQKWNASGSKAARVSALLSPQHVMPLECRLCVSNSSLQADSLFVFQHQHFGCPLHPPGRLRSFYHASGVVSLVVRSSVSLLGCGSWETGSTALPRALDDLTVGCRPQGQLPGFAQPAGGGSAGGPAASHRGGPGAAAGSSGCGAATSGCGGGVRIERGGRAAGQAAAGGASAAAGRSAAASCARRRLG